jgi:hypothetical protein
MRRELPAKPNLEHLKSQAKDLLDAHRRGEPVAFARIRASVPAFANWSDEQIVRGPFALHDAQSAIAREYGCASWAELRTKVAAGTDPDSKDPVDLQLQVARIGGQLSPAMEAAVREALALRGTQTDAPTPRTVPVIPLRNSVVFPGSLIPMDIARPSSMRAIESAMHSEPAFLAVFSQRAFDTEHPTSDDLHPTGCLSIVRLLLRAADDPEIAARTHPVTSGPPQACVFVEGVRWITLEALEQIDPYYLARVAEAPVENVDEPRVAELGSQLRELAHRFADTMTGAQAQVHALIDRTSEPRDLADLVVANFPVPVADKASYAEETLLSRKLDRAIALLVDELAKVQAAAAPT